MTGIAIVTQAVRTRTVTDESAGLRFPLTCGIANDELVRLEAVGLENSLNRWPKHARLLAMVARA